MKEQVQRPDTEHFICSLLLIRRLLNSAKEDVFEDSVTILIAVDYHSHCPELDHVSRIS